MNRITRLLPLTLIAASQAFGHSDAIPHSHPHGSALSPIVLAAIAVCAFAATAWFATRRRGERQKT